MISRNWHGWTSHEKAETYENLLREEVFTGIKGRRIPGFVDIQMLRRPLDNEVEFITRRSTPVSAPGNRVAYSEQYKITRYLLQPPGYSKRNHFNR